MIVQIVNNVHRNNLVKFEKDSPFCFWVIEWMVISIFLNIGTVKFLKTLHTAFNVSKEFFQIKIFNEINFLLILIYILF